MEDIEILEELNQKYDRLCEDMGRMVELVIEIYNKVGNHPKNEEPQRVLEPDLAYEQWRDSVNNKTKLLVNNRNFKNNREVLNSVYEKMTRVYGVCWEQETIDFRSQHHEDRASKLAIVYNQGMLRSIFDSILNGMVGECMSSISSTVSSECVDKIDEYAYGSCDLIISPLVEKYNDNSRYGCATFRRVYSRMEQDGNVDWKRAETRYINKHGTNGMTKKLVIESSATLMKKFKDSVNYLMAEAS